MERSGKPLPPTDASRDERNFVNAILDSAGALFVVFDREGRIRRFNRACEELTRYSFVEVEGRCVWDFLPPPEEARRVKEQAHLLFNRYPEVKHGGSTHYCVSKMGEKRLIEWSSTVMANDRGAAEFIVSIGVDITERHEAEAALRRSKETYASAEEITHIGSWDWNIVTNGLHWSDEIFRIFGQTPQSFGATYPAFLEAVHPADRQAVIDAVNASVADARAPYSIEHRVVRPDGAIRIVHECGKVYRDARGNPVRMIGTVHDITERKNAEMEFRTILQTTADGFWMVDPKDARLLDVNPAYCGISGYTREELLSMRVPDIEAVETPEETRRHIEEVMQGRHMRFDTIHRRKDGGLVHMDISVKYIDTRGGVIVVFLRDITERKLLEAELRNYREGLERLVRERTSMLQEAQRIGRMGNWHWDVASGNLTWSEEIYRIFGHQPGGFQPTYERFLAALPPEDVERIKQSEQDAFSQGKRHSIDHRIILPSGEIRWVHEEAVATLDKNGQPVSLAGTVQDITERKQTEQALIKAKEEAEYSSQAKSSFLSRMSHELRTPMNAILGFAQVLEMEPITAEQQSFVREIHDAGNHLLELINELLDLSRIEAGRLPIVLQPVALGAIAAQATQLVTPLLHKHGITLINQCDPAIKVVADPTRLRQILVNLLSNAAKYNRSGGSIRVACEAIGAERLRISVTDTGPGIEAEKRAQLFLPFERLGAEFTGVEGTGIGLALSQNMAQLMGGELGVESAPGQGSTFWLDLPCVQDARQPEPVQQGGISGQLAGKARILYIEDNAANLKVVEAMLRRQPELTLLSATNGEYGLELAQRYRPHAILLDIHLPGMDGYAVLEALKAEENTRRIPVIALSADAMPLDIEKGLSAGFSRYLTKPVKAQEIVDAVGGVMADTAR